MGYPGVPQVMSFYMRSKYFLESKFLFCKVSHSSLAGMLIQLEEYACGAPVFRVIKFKTKQKCFYV